MTLKLLGRELASACYREKEDALKFSKEVRKRVHEEWDEEVRTFIDTNVLLIGSANLVLKRETAETKVLRGHLERRIKLVYAHGTGVGLVEV